MAPLFLPHKRRLGFHLQRCYEKISQITDQCLHELSMNAREYRILTVLAEGMVPPNQASVAHECGCHVNTMVEHAAAMERKGWLHREPDPTDGRKQQMILTAVGKKTLRRATARIEVLTDFAENDIGQEEWESGVTFLIELHPLLDRMLRDYDELFTKRN